MREIRLILLFVTCAFSMAHSQEIQITSFDVLYKTSNFNETDSSGIEVTPKTNFTFNSLTSVDKINFKIYSLESNALIYNVNYNLSSGDVIATNGEILYSKTGTNISINTPNSFSLVPFKFEVEAEDSVGNIVLTYSEIK